MDYEFDTRFQHPFTMMVSGCSGSGKTYFTKKMIDNCISPPLDSVIWFYSEWQESYDTMPSSVQMVPGMPGSLEKYIEGDGNRALVFDDLMTECAKNDMLADAFTKLRHHRNISVVLLVQNLFIQGKVMRTIHLNTEYFILFSNLRDKTQIRHLAMQLEPAHVKKLMAAYVDATATPHSHLLVDLKPHTPSALRYRANSLSRDAQIVYTVTGL